MEVRQFGTAPDGRAVKEYVLQNSVGMRAGVLNFGGILTSLWVPDREGRLGDVVLGYDTWEPYRENPFAFGAVIGRCANRIADAAFTWNGTRYPLTPNFGRHHLHGGELGFQRVLWDASCCGDAAVKLSYRSRDGEEGYPGNLDVEILYALGEDNTLSLRYTARSDRDTLVNLTNHSYFNLTGSGAQSILSHRLYLPMERVAVIDKERMPTGQIRQVAGTPMDFREPKCIGENLSDPAARELPDGGFDHSWLVDSSGPGKQVRIARLEEPDSGRVMEVFTTMPAVQIFTPLFPDNRIRGKGGDVYQGRNAICFETNYVPNAINLPAFESPVLRAGQTYDHTTIFKFSVE